MKRTSLLAFVVLLGVFHLSCALAPIPTPVTDPMQSLQLQGFSILPPRGTNWFIQQQGTRDVVFAKKLRERIEQPEDSHSILASARVTNLGDLKFRNSTELLQSLAQTWAKGKIDARHKLIESKVFVDKCQGWDCMKYEFAAEDRGVPQFPGSVFVMTIHGLLFIHPDFPNLTITLEYSQRFLQGQQPLTIEGEIEPFLKSLVFVPLKGRSEDAFVYYGRGLFRGRQGDPNGALEDFTKALEINPNFAAAYLDRAVSRNNLSDYAGAYMDVNKALETDPKSIPLAKAYELRSHIGRMLGDYKDAIEDSTKALQIDSGLAKAYEIRGLARHQLRDLEDARKDLEKALELDPNLPNKAFIQAILRSMRK